jgi:hypothetical protein
MINIIVEKLIVATIIIKIHTWKKSEKIIIVTVINFFQYFFFVTAAAIKLFV